MAIKIALAGNPNSGKTTLFNALTGSNQFVGNWPGVTVEKKEGKLKKHDDVTIMDLPGIYSLSPYTLEEVVARNYLITERPDAILNIIDGTNLERNLYLTTQLTELGIPVVIALNMMDVVTKSGDKINTEELSRQLGCKVVEISALKGDGVAEAAEAAIAAAGGEKTIPQHSFSGAVEHALAHIEECIVHDLPEEQQRWYAIKIFERDDKVLEQMNIPTEKLEHVEGDIKAAETELDDDSESIITNERYVWIASIMQSCLKKAKEGALTKSDKIDKVVTNRWLALPIFALVMYIVYYVSISTIGTMGTDWVNDNLFDEGYHLFGIGASAYDEAAEEYAPYASAIEAFEAAAEEQSIDIETASVNELAKIETSYDVVNEETGEIEETVPVSYIDYQKALKIEEPDHADYGVWVPSIPDLVGGWLDALGCAEWLRGLIIDGIIGGVGAVLGFLPQMLVLFFFLAFLEGCGYMARVAFIMDRIFRKFGLSGKSFIPMLIGAGCGVPAVMASRTIENERDRRMTIMTTTFIPCGAKLPIIALIAGALFGGAPWVAPSAYFIGVAAIIVSGIMLKKTRMFAGDPAPFVMELPAYHMPTIGSIFRSMWERAWSFIKKAGTVILLSAIVLWFLQAFGFTSEGFGMVDDLNDSILANIGNTVAWIFNPLGWGDWKAAVATVTGLIAKENVVGTFGVLYGVGEVAEDGAEIWGSMQQNFSAISGFSFLIFNLLCAPCFAAIGAIKREMNSAKWTWFAIGYQCGFAYAVSLIVYQLGSAIQGNINPIGLAAAVVLLAFFGFMLFRPYKESNKLTQKIKVK